ncbi:hypothetical protein [Crossiella sp. CA198]|uniref:hypothetical protein n=1 Tax=Crossiella sp. CA198 TaxID=3455607 RepID=UPI003F8D664F
MSQETLEVTNLEALFGEVEEQKELFDSELAGVDTSGGLVMTTIPCVTVTARISIIRRC